jgi:hypothetical protein
MRIGVTLVLPELKYMKSKFQEFTDSQWQVIEKILDDRTGGPEKKAKAFAENDLKCHFFYQ